VLITPETFLALPWVLAPLLHPVLIRRRPRLRDHAAPAAQDAPFVSIIVPARNEAENIGACVASLLRARYPRYEIIVVDDRSTDGTGAIVRILAEHHTGRVRIVEGGALPEGWVGKCWACWQGYREARGELLLFTDADTRHDRDLLGHAVGAARTTGANLVTVFPRQRMVGFWECVILPHIFTAILARYNDLARMNRTTNPRNVIANGQFILFDRQGYEVVGGHEAVRGEIVEDLRLAQLIVSKGHRMYAAHANDLMETRMYRSFAGIVEGWTKNLAGGARQSVPRVLRPAVPWLIGLVMLFLWVVPPLALVAQLPAPRPAPLLASGASLVFWGVAYHRLGVRPTWALIFPLGAIVTALLFFRSAARGGRVMWKGRMYDTAGAGRGGSAS